MTRGSIVSVRLPRRRGHEQRGSRPGVVVQANEFLALSTVIVAPTSRSAPARSFRPEIAIGGDVTRVLIEQIGVFDLRVLGDEIGRLSAEEQRAVDDALRLVVGLT